MVGRLKSFMDSEAASAVPLLGAAVAALVLANLILAPLARLLGREGGASGHWRQVWARRREWQEGFPALPHP